MNLKTELIEAAERAYHFQDSYWSTVVIPSHTVFDLCCDMAKGEHNDVFEDPDHDVWFLLICAEALSDE
jgi:hypothetical protein